MLIRDKEINPCIPKKYNKIIKNIIVASGVWDMAREWYALTADTSFYNMLYKFIWFFINMYNLDKNLRKEKVQGICGDRTILETKVNIKQKEKIINVHNIL